MTAIVPEIDEIVKFYSSELVEEIARETGFVQRDMIRSCERIIPRGDKLYIYYCGVHGPHGGPKFPDVVRKHRTAIGLAVLCRDGFVSLDAGNDEGYIRIKCNLFNNDILEFSEYLVLEKDSIVIKRYNFHWQKFDGTLITRWDNVEHHPEIKSFPHHVHEGEEKLNESDPMNFDKVISFIEDKLNKIERK